MQLEAIPIDLNSLVGETAKIKAQGYRLVTLTCVELGENTVDLLYHFGRDLDLIHLRMTTPKDELIPSISPVYFSAFMVENEISDLFGLHFQGLAIDYDRTFYLEEEAKNPFCSSAPDPASET